MNAPGKSFLLIASKITMLLCICEPKVFAEGNPSSENVAKIQQDANQGDAAAQAQLADLYRYGKGVKKDYKQSFQWAAKAADQGNAQAQHYLGICYTYEIGVKKDLAAAFKWFKKSADQGYANGQYRVGACYLEGDGVPRNDDQGVEWLLKAANQGDADSKFLLGWHYLKKAGAEREEFDSVEGQISRMRRDSLKQSISDYTSIITEDYEYSQIQSYMWFNLALADGHVEAKKTLKLLSDLMKQDLIDQAQRKSAEWKPEK